MIYERFWVAYEKDKKLMLDLYQEIKGYRKSELSKSELKDLHEDTFQTLKELLYGEDVNYVLVNFFSEINQYKYTGLPIDFKFLIFSDAVPYGKHNREILKKYLKSKDIERVIRIINYLGIIVDITYAEENKLYEIYDIKLKDPDEEKTKSENTDNEKTSRSSFKDTIYNFLSSVGNRVRDIAIEIDKFFRKISGYRYIRDFLKDLIDDVLYFIASEPLITATAGAFTLFMVLSVNYLSKLLRSDSKLVASSVKSLVNKLSNISILTNRFVKASVKLSVMASSVYLLKKIFKRLRQNVKEYYLKQKIEYEKMRDENPNDRYIYEYTDRMLNFIEEKLSESGYRKLINLIKQKFGRELLESINIVSTIVKAIYSVIWVILIFITNIALVLSEVKMDTSNRLKILGILSALGISNMI